MEQNIWFSSDLHIYHKNILKHCPERMKQGEFTEESIEKHDKWLLDIWNNTIKKKDIVYIIGDFSFANPEWTKKILSKMNGKKFLILGNHDKSSEHLDGYFEQITQMKMVTFKKSNYDFLEEDFMTFMCHYPMITWNSKHWGCCLVHGHCHGRLDDYNEESPDLRVDVGWDGKLSNFKPISLEHLYKYFKEKTKGEKFMKYAEQKKQEREMII